MQNDGSRYFHAILLTLLVLALGSIVFGVLWSASDFYLTGLEERAHHDDFRMFRPAGEIGHGLGIVGSAMVLLLLLYSVRKRSRQMRTWGSLRTWLRYHIFLGVAGPVLITLHTSFKINGLVALSYWSMAAVALSGVFGRYLYQQLPRNVLGEEMEPGPAETRREEILVLLSERWGLDAQGLDTLEHFAMGRLEGRSAPSAMIRLPLLNIGLARGLLKLKLKGRQPLGAAGLELAREWVLLSRRLHLFHTIRDLFHWWHVFHKPFAVIMIVVMLVHVGVAVALGYTWIY